MKAELCIGILCITIIIVVALALGFDGAMAASGVALIGGLLGWQGKKQLDKRGTNTEALTASLKRAGFTDPRIQKIVDVIKKRG